MREHIGREIAAGAAEAEAGFVHHPARQIIFDHVAIETAGRRKGVCRDGAQPFQLALGAGQIGGAAGAAVIRKLRFQAGVGAGVEPQRGGPFRGISDPFSKNRIEQCEQLIIGGRLRQRRAITPSVAVPASN